MKIAFYAPMKPPSHPVPSGDRTMARLLIQCLEKAGYQIQIASEFSSRDGLGDTNQQRRLEQEGAAEAARLIEQMTDDPPGCWITYHLYHKAPDWLGPAVTKTFGIPYIVVEASVAGKQADGPWNHGFKASIEALKAADLVLQPNPDDLKGVASWLKPGATMSQLNVPVDTTCFAPAHDRPSLRATLATSYDIPEDTVWIVTAAMMREGDKLASYRVMAESLGRIQHRNWTFIAAGDGPAKEDVVEAFSDRGNVVFPGALAREDIAALFAAADLYFWPGVNEAFGFSTLEAQAAGLPALVGNRAGICALTQPGRSALHHQPEDASGFAAGLADLIDAPDRRAEMAKEARINVEKNHDINIVAQDLKALVDSVQASRKP